VDLEPGVWTKYRIVIDGTKERHSAGNFLTCGG